MKREKITNKKVRLLPPIGSAYKTVSGLTKVLLFSSFLLFSLFFLLLSCEQPFKAGLGPIVDLRIPRIELTAPLPTGSYIRGVQRFEGTADDDNKMDSVYFQLTTYPTVDLSAVYPEYKPYEHPILGIFYRIPDSNISGNARDWKWYFEINTMLFENGVLENGVRVFPDGDFSIRLLARDIVGKENADKAQEYPFYVKNDIPLINVSQPSIVPGAVDGDLGSDRLNFGYLSDREARKEPFKRVMDTEGLMSGLISDTKGIYRGKPMIAVIAEDGDPIKELDGTPILDNNGKIKVDKSGNPKVPKLDDESREMTVELFWPQIRFWQVALADPWQAGEGKTTDADGNVMYLPGYLPPVEEIPWAKLSVMEMSAKDLSFTYELPKESGTFWGFEIRAQSEDEVHASARYPRDWYNNIEGKTEEYQKENSYVLLLVREPTEYPVLELYKLEDIYGDTDAWKRDENGSIIYKDLSIDYRGLPIDEQDKSDGKHPYVDKPIVNKNGPFVLRVKASHSQNISNVKVYWEKDDRSLRGRFIWDPVDETVPKAWENKTPAWRGGYKLAREPFETWGRNEPDGGTRVRSFVFTYPDKIDDPRYRIPNEDKYNSYVKGRTKVQIYNGTLNFEELETADPEDIKADWQDLDTPDARVANGLMPEGTYNLTIYARSGSSTRIGAPFLATINIDREEPDVELIEIEGSAGEENNKETNYERLNIVNGVIQPRFLIQESRPVDTRLRTGTVDYFKRPKNNDSDSDSYYPEQAYILIPEAQKSAMAAYLVEHPWPEFPNFQGGAPVIPGVTISKHGLIIGSVCRFRTSKIYYGMEPELPLPSTPEPGILANGRYRLYAFARDNAFNVASKSYPIEVDEATDYPTFDFSGSSIETGVMDPDSLYDFEGKEAKNPLTSFIIKDNKIRNRLTANSVIQVRIKDDDSLDLGQNAATLKNKDDKDVKVEAQPSGIKVTFIGSEFNTTKKELDALSPDSVYLETLTDAEIKEAFPPQNVDPETGKRIPVKEILGTINQTVLLNHLKNNENYNDLFGVLKERPNPDKPGETLPADTPEQIAAKKAGFNSLPDGIYRVGISIRDYQPAKLSMPDDPRPADYYVEKKMPVDLKAEPAIYTEYFWIAVDSKNPVITVDFMKPSVYDPSKTRPSGQIISKSGGLLTGWVSDEIGPITLVDWKVFNLSEKDDNSQKGDVVPANRAKIDTDGEIEISGKKYKLGLELLNSGDPGYELGKWKYKFTYFMNMNGKEKGTFTFEIKYKDRFGNTTSVSLMYTIDNEPPKVSLTRPIETFSRPFDDVDLKPDEYPQDPANTAPDLNNPGKFIYINKERLAVKTVNFSVNAVDNFMVTGIRWWLLPWNVGSSTKNGYDDPNNNGGNVTNYYAFPADYTGFSDPGTYYPENGGAYGYVNSGTATIAIDTTKMKVQNGEYRLHIIAIDDAGNESYVTQDSSIPPKSTSNLFQTVFFLQEEDRPYFGGLDNITPGVVVTGAEWPNVEMDVRGGNPIIRGTIYENNGFFGKEDKTFWSGSITIWFSNDDTVAGNPLPTTPVTEGLPYWEYLVKSGQDIPGYTKKQIPNDITSGNIGLGNQGRNISLAIELTSLFPGAFNNDGKKRYIIKATDSPVNKLYYDGLIPTKPHTPGIPMGLGNTDTYDEGVRVSRWRQFAFVYDAIPPKVEIINPPKDENKNKFGTNFASDEPDPDTRPNPSNPVGPGNLPLYKKGFNLVGSISDANLATMTFYWQNLKSTDPLYDARYDKTSSSYVSTLTDSRYYFEYYLDSNTTPRYLFILDERTGVHITETPATATDPLKVTFNIDPSVVAAPRTTEAGIIPQDVFDKLAEGQHTLNVFAWDKSGKEGTAWVSFTKDTEPPTIAFSNLDQKPYDENNKSKVDKPTTTTNSGWWGKSTADRQALLFSNASNAPILTTIYYDNGVPELRGTINDLVSNIDLSVVNSNSGATVTSHASGNISASDVGNGDINNSGSTFRYWIDNEYQLKTEGGKTVPTTEGRYLAVIEGAGSKSVRWTINLTDTGTTNTGTLKGTPLCDGVHTIVLTVADVGGTGIPEEKRYMIAFRIDSKQPKSAAGVAGALGSVYGNVAYQDDTMFTVSLGAQDANLDRVVLSILKKANPDIPNDTEKLEVERTFRPWALPAGATGTWAYAPFDSKMPLPVFPTIPDGLMKGGIPIPPLTTHPTSVPLAEDYIVFIGSFPVPKTLFTDAISGKYDVKVVAFDTFNNKSEEFVWSFTYDRDQPKIIFTNPEKTSDKNDLKPRDFVEVDSATGPAKIGEDGVLVSKNNINYQISENLRIQGSVIDTYSAISEVESRIEKWNWNGANVGNWTVIMDQGKEWAPVRDLSTNQALQISWTKNLLGQNNTSSNPNVDLDLSGRPAGSYGKDPLTPVDLAKIEGLYRIRIRARDASYIPNSTVSANWDAPLNSGIANPAGKGNPVFSDYVYFYFDRTNPTLVITKINNQETTTMATYYSKLDSGFKFEGTVTDNNRFAKVEVKFESGGKLIGQPIAATLTTTTGTAPDFAQGAANRGEATQNWKAEFPSNTVFPDGRYKVTITAYDMTGRSTKEEKSFILDSTPPGARFTGPTKEKDTTNKPGYGLDEDPSPPKTNFRSVVVQGGVTSVITGETWDKPGEGGENGSESGIDKMWYRLGYIDNNNNFPTKALVTTDANDLITAAKTGANANKTDNELMDIVSEADGNAWFSLGGQRKPTGFVINNPNIYDWRMEIPNKTADTPIPNTDPNYADHYATMVDGKRLSEGGVQIGGLKLYGGTITVKGRSYSVGATPAGGRQMVRVAEGSVYRLPLWIRLVDKAGNVAYYCHDIWIYPDGDIPWTTIESPANGTKTNARGGSISVDGVAHSNTSVYDVVFRVFADGNGSTAKQDTNLSTATAPVRPVAADLVRVTGYEPADAATIAKISEWAGSTYTDTPWQQANLTLPRGAGEPQIPWSIMLNREDQIKNLIPTKGFIYGANVTTNNTIRVWLEVFVLNGEGSPIRTSIYPAESTPVADGSLNGNANKPGAKPYVRAFFIQSGEVEITHPNVGNWNVPANPTTAPSGFFDRANFRWNAEVSGNQGGGGYKGAGTEMRRDKFAFSATLKPGAFGLGEVSFRIKLDGGAYGTWNTAWKTGDNPLPTNTAPFNSTAFSGVRISLRDTGRYYFDYAINSRSAAPAAESGTNFAPVNGGNWQYTGGTVTLQIRMRDNFSPPNEAEQTIVVSVDNFTPVADTKSYGNSKVAGSNVDFQGRIYDYATAPAADAMSPTDEYKPKKLDRVYAWFTKGNATTTPYVNMMTGATGTPPATQQLLNVLSGRNATITGGGSGDTAVTGINLDARGNVPNGTTMTFPASADWVREISERTAIPGSKMVWNPVNSSVYDVRWSFTLDSTKLPDGYLTLHYIVVDAAGNASYYTQPTITVKNKYPQIDKVTLYTQNLGIGAAYTQPDQVEYNVNDYRSAMFYNYRDQADYDKANNTGYLNSGFISKNNYIGFKVEASKGNRALSFRLQHVTRQRMKLNSTNLNGWLADRDKADNINLYTIAWHGDYSSANWKALGVPVDNPTLGTHFVLQSPPAGAEIKYSDSAEVWKYTIRATKPDVTPTGTAQQEDPAVNPVVLGPDNFRFYDTADFANIAEKDGSHPDEGDKKPNNPTATDDKGTAFFLIRVWDSVGGAATGEAQINEKLHDALVVGMNVYKTDKTDPVARLYDLNPYTESAVSGNNLTDANKNATIRNAADPQAMGSNIVRGGLFNQGTERAMIRSGFIDPRDQSKALAPVNGLYDNGTLINGVDWPDYPLRVAGDTVPTTGTNRDKVSGRVILRGLAWDDQLLYRIQISINGTVTTILELDTATATMKAAGTTIQAYTTETLNWKTGHTVEWAYVWDTGTVPNNDQTVRVIAVDYKGAASGNPPGRSSPAITADTATAYHNQVSVDIVPYITGFERATPTFTTKRSMQGWYSFYQGEQDVKVNGYNFGAGSATINLNGTSVGTVTNGTPADKQRVFNIPTGGTSGAITMTTSSMAAYNNTSTTAGKSWNKEVNTYTPGSDLWTNRHYAHIWQTNEQVGNGSTAGTIIAGTNSSSGMDTPAGKASPSMALQYAGDAIGRLHAVWSVYNLDSIAYGNNAGPSTGAGALNGYIRVNRSGDPYSATDMDYYNGGTPNGYINNVSTVALYQRDGGGRLILRPTVVERDVNGGDDASLVVGAGPATVWGSTFSTDTERYQNPRIRKLAVSTGDANPGTVIISSFDSYDKRLLYTRQSGNLTNSSGATFGNTSLQFFLDGGGTVDTGNNTRSEIGSVSIVAGSVTNNAVSGAIARSNSAGQYSAIDYTSDNRPVIAYFDDQNQTLRLLYANSDNPTAGNAWTRRYVLPAGDALRLGSGSYVSMKIDRAKSDTIHLAFYNSNNKAIVYASGTTTGAFTASVIDRVVEGGQWTDIAVDTSGNPWIVYADSTRTGNRDGVRIAYRSTAFTRALTDPISGNSITGWEAMTMPANYKVINDRLNIAAWPPTGYSGSATSSPIGNWHAAVGYGSDKFRIGYFIKPTGSPVMANQP